MAGKGFVVLTAIQKETIEKQMIRLIKEDKWLYDKADQR